MKHCGDDNIDKVDIRTVSILLTICIGVCLVIAEYQLVPSLCVCVFYVFVLSLDVSL